MAGLVRLAALAASAVVALGFLMFAAEEAEKGSRQQVAKINEALAAPAPSPTEERTRERQHDGLRELIDDANDVLLSPFADVVGGGDDWMQRIVPALLALLFYGLGGMLLANYLPQPKRKTGDWREAA